MDDEASVDVEKGPASSDSPVAEASGDDLKGSEEEGEEEALPTESQKEAELTRRSGARDDDDTVENIGVVGSTP